MRLRPSSPKRQKLPNAASNPESPPVDMQILEEEDVTLQGNEEEEEDEEERAEQKGEQDEEEQEEEEEEDAFFVLVGGKAAHCAPPDRDQRQAEEEEELDDDGDDDDDEEDEEREGMGLGLSRQAPATGRYQGGSNHNDGDGGAGPYDLIDELGQVSLRKLQLLKLAADHGIGPSAMTKLLHFFKGLPPSMLGSFPWTYETLSAPYKDSDELRSIHVVEIPIPKDARDIVEAPEVLPFV